MINWKELEKFIAPGKVVTLVVMVDGTEIGALSFNVDSLAYKSVLEAAVKATEPTVKIADKSPVSVEIKKAEEVRKESLKAKKGSKPEVKIVPTDNMDLPEEEEEEEEEEEDNDPIITGDGCGNNVDCDTGEIIEENKDLPDFKPLPEKKEPEPERRLTRAEIMAQTAEAEKPEVSNEVKTHIAETNKAIEASKPVEEKKVVEQTFGEEW